MAAAAVAKRRGSKSAHAARAAAKQRRQTIVAAVLAAVLVALLAYEVPHMLKLFHKRPSAATAVSTQLPSAPAGRHGTRPVHGGGSGADPFALRSVPNGDPRVAAAGGPDPFTGPAASSAVAASQSAP